MAVDPESSTERHGTVGAEPVPSVHETFRYAQDVKCFHCGFISGQLSGDPRLPRGARPFVPSPGSETPPGFRSDRLRCLRCGGPCFLDEVEAIVVLGPAALEKPRRGRKPKALGR